MNEDYLGILYGICIGYCMGYCIGYPVGHFYFERGMSFGIPTFAERSTVDNQKNIPETKDII